MLRPILHTTLGLLLCFSLLVAGVAGASAGVTMLLAEGETELVICADGGSQVVTLDARGRVVDPHKACDRCPACALATVLAAASPAYLSRPVTSLRGRLAFFFISPDLRQAFGLPSARAPPARV